jgi:hypothetical protein
MDDLGIWVRFLAGAEIFLSVIACRPILDPTSLLSSGSHGVLPRDEVSRALNVDLAMKAKKLWSYTSTRKPRLIVGCSANPLPLRDTILRRLYSVHIFAPLFSKIHFNIILLYKSGSLFLNIPTII